MYIFVIVNWLTYDSKKPASFCTPSVSLAAIHTHTHTHTTSPIHQEIYQGQSITASLNFKKNQHQVNSGLLLTNSIQLNACTTQLAVNSTRLKHNSSQLAVGSSQLHVNSTRLALSSGQLFPCAIQLKLIIYQLISILSQLKSSSSSIN
jgi:hypothetical protein